jgi:hypothetical protein
MRAVSDRSEAFLDRLCAQRSLTSRVMSCEPRVTVRYALVQSMRPLRCHMISQRVPHAHQPSASLLSFTSTPTVVIYTARHQSRPILPCLSTFLFPAVQFYIVFNYYRLLLLAAETGMQHAVAPTFGSPARGFIGKCTRRNLVHLRVLG